MLNSLAHSAPSCEEMLKAMLLSQAGSQFPRNGETLEFIGADGLDVYNLTAPFEIDGYLVIAARVEPREIQVSDIHFFRQDQSKNGSICWVRISDAPVFTQMQDPCIARIGKEVVFGGVRYPLGACREDSGWQMRFYRGDSLNNLKPFLDGPANMKDIRLVELQDGRVGVFTRPHEGIGPDGAPIKFGTIGFTVADSLDQITAEMIAMAPLIRNQVTAGEKVGANEIHLLRDGRLGVLSHAARDAEDGQHYCATSFIFNPVTLEATPMKAIAHRAHFPTGPAKRATLEDVVFSGGLERRGNGVATIYCGLSDCECGCIEIEDPFEH